MFKLFERNNIPLVGDHVPIEEPLTKNVLRLTDGSAFLMMSLRGWNAETADIHDFVERHQRSSTTYLNMPAAERLVISSYVCRGMGDGSTLPPVDRRLLPWAAGMSKRYLDMMSEGGLLYTNDLYVGLHLRAPAGTRGWGRRGTVSEERAIDRALRLEDVAGWFMSEMSRYEPRILGLVTRGRQVFSEAAEALAYAVTGVWRPVPLTTGRLGDTMFSEEVSFHHETVELRGPAHTSYAAMLTLRQYPAVTWPGILDTLLSAPLRFTLHQTFEPLSHSASLNLLTRRQNKMIWADDKARSQLADLDAAANDVAGGQMLMGRHGLTLAVFADTPGSERNAYQRFIKTLNGALRSVGLGAVANDVMHEVVEGLKGRRDPLAAVVNEAWQRLARTAGTVTRENRALMGTWKSLLPGNQRFRSRPGACSNRNFAALAPNHSHGRGTKRSRWGGPIAILRNTAGEPYAFHWHDGEGDAAVGNFIATGAPGSGKTSTLGFLAAHTAGRANVIMLDDKRGWEALVGHLGGPYAILGDGRPMFAPLRAMGPEDAPFLFDLFRGCIMQGGWRSMTSEEDRLLSLGIETVMENPPEERSLTEVVAFLAPDADEEGAGARLARWCWGQELGWVLDAPRCSLQLGGTIVGLDTTRLMANQRAASPALTYIFRRIAQSLDGRKPVLLLLDEGWKVLGDPLFFRLVEEQFRTIRSKNGVIGFATQSPSDLRNSAAGKVVLEMAPNQIHFPNPNASKEDYIEVMKRTAGEVEALKGLEKGSGRFLYCNGSESVVCELPLRGMPDELAVFSAPEASLRVLEAIPADQRAAPERLQTAYAAGRARMAEEQAREDAQ